MKETESRSAKLTRRSFLKAVGLTAAALPFYQLLENNVVLAQTGQLPLKFIGLGTFHGTTQRFYARQPGETDTQYSLNYADSPFAPFDDAATYGTSFKDRLTIFEGFDYGVGEVAKSGAAMHVPMHGALGLFLTGSSAISQDDQRLQNESLDQFLAAKYGGTTRFRSLQLRGLDMQNFDASPQWVISFGAGGVGLSPIDNPMEVWNKYFVGTIVGNDAAAKAAAARKQAIGASILDFVVKDITRMQGRLAGAEREKLDQHLTVIRDLERRLGDFTPGGMCTTPPKPDPKTRGYTMDKFTPGNVRPTCDIMLELMGEIIACDLTRFITFVMPNEFGEGRAARTATNQYTGGSITLVDGTETDPFPIYNTMHDDCAHQLADATQTGANALFSQRMISAVNRLYNKRIAKLMARLDSAGVLDSTLILVGNEGGQGAAHSTSHVPLLLLGGANGKVKLGRRIVAPGRTARANQESSGAKITSHNPILVSVANLFGANIESFGTCANPAYTKGVSSLLG